MVRGVAAQVEFESKTRKRLTMFQFKSLIPGALNVGLIGFKVGLIGSTCTALPSTRSWMRIAARPGLERHRSRRPSPERCAVSARILV